MRDPSGMFISLAIVVGVVAVYVAISYYIGKARNRVAAGIVLGLLLGPIGWLIVAVLPTVEPPGRHGRCPRCGAGITIPANFKGAGRCPRCGGAFTV